MELVSKPRCSPFVIKQLEWFKTAAGFLLIMEQPHSFITLGKFRKGLKGRMSEDVARIITRKIIQALIHCRDNGVIHGDIKEANILLNPETLDLKLIDFGRARLIYRRLYKFGGNFTSWMSRFNRNLLVDYFCDLANDILSLSFIQSFQFPFHLVGYLSFIPGSCLLLSGVWVLFFIP